MCLLQYTFRCSNRYPIDVFRLENSIDLSTVTYCVGNIYAKTYANIALVTPMILSA